MRASNSLNQTSSRHLLKVAVTAGVLEMVGVSVRRRHTRHNGRRKRSNWPTLSEINRGIGADGQPVKIAVLDTGVDFSHPALAGHLLPGFDFVDFDNDPSEVGNQTTGPFGHGTHVAGLIALVAPDAKIIPVRVLDQKGIGNTWVLAEALAYAADPDGNPATHDGADVINLSLSTLRRTRLLRDVLEKVCGEWWRRFSGNRKSESGYRCGCG